MTINEFIAKYTGQRVGDGQCGTLVRQYWIEVDQTNPPSYPDSKDYWFNPVPGYIKSSSPIPGAIAIYNGHGIYTEGHSAISLGGTMVFEQNADPDGSPAHQFNRANTYLLGYLIKEEIVSGVTINGAPCSVGTPETRIDVFARGSDDNLYQKYFVNGWSDWVKVGGGIASSPSVPSPYANDRIDVFFTGIGGDLVHTYFNGKQWTPNESLGQPQKG